MRTAIARYFALIASISVLSVNSCHKAGMPTEVQSLVQDTIVTSNNSHYHYGSISLYNVVEHSNWEDVKDNYTLKTHDDSRWSDLTSYGNSPFIFPGLKLTLVTDKKTISTLFGVSDPSDVNTDSVVILNIPYKTLPDNSIDIVLTGKDLGNIYLLHHDTYLWLERTPSAGGSGYWTTEVITSHNNFEFTDSTRLEIKLPYFQ